MTASAPESNETRHSITNNVSYLYQVYCSYIILFRNTEKKQDFLPLDLLQKSLRVLVRKYYQPVAGWFDINGDEIDVVYSTEKFNDPPFSSQTLSMDYSTLTQHVHESNTELLVPKFPSGIITKENTDIPMFLAKATYVDDGSAVVLGVTYHHSLMDGSALWMFMSNWASVSRQLSVQGDQVDFDLPFPPTFGFPSIDHMRDASQSFDHIEYAIVDAKDCAREFQPGAEPIVETIFTISVEQQLEIRGMARDHGVSFTEMLCAIFWKGISEVKLRAKPDIGQAKSLFTCAVNPRGKLDLSNTLCASPVINMAAWETVAAVSEYDVGCVAQLVNQSLNKCMGAYLASSFEFILAQRKRELEDERNRTVDKKSMLVYVLPMEAKCTVSSSRTFPIYETDFGFGRPEYVRPPFLPFDGCLRIWPTPRYSCKPGADGAPLEIYLSQPESLDLASSPLLRQFMH
ncbi:hypothetical protein H4R24_001527 [Coemansia sp. RSA 988]|nr:hypothetical protein H4R24_001527 [Coemansia sp. RSA 988]